MGNQWPERMDSFFDVRAETYDQHMKENIESFDEFYKAVASCISPSLSEVRILDIGCGTGLELVPVFRRVPGAEITAVDLSAVMLKKLKTRFTKLQRQVTLVQGSYLTVPFAEGWYDYAISVMTLHHLLPGIKTELYRRIYSALKPGGKYMEGDFVVSLEEERKYRIRYERFAAQLEGAENGSYHIDIPLSLHSQLQLLREAGFSETRVIREQNRAAVYMAERYHQ